MTTAKELLSMLEGDLPSVEQLSDLLIKGKYISKPFKRGKKTGDFIPIDGPANAEIYGKKAYITVHVSDKEEATKFLKGEGIKVNKYDVEDVIEVPIKYFKGLHWDE